jgi:hypothetical protein
MATLRPEARRWVEDVEQQMRQLPKGMETSQSFLAETIANVCWHHGDDSYRDWFRRALELRASGCKRATSRSLFIHWKLGDWPQIEKECDEIQARHGGVAGLLAAATSGGRAGLAAACQNMVTANLLKGDWKGTVRWAEGGGQGKLEPRPHGLDGSLVMAEALIKKKGKRFVQALELLHQHFPTWPLYEPDWVRDLFRFGLALKEQYFPRERLPFA